MDTRRIDRARTNAIETAKRLADELATVTSKLDDDSLVKVHTVGLANILHELIEDCIYLDLVRSIDFEVR